MTEHWKIRGFELRYLPQVGWLVCKQGEVFCAFGSVLAAIRFMKEERK